MPNLRIKVVCLLKSEWMFCDLKKLKTISDLAVKIKERYDIHLKNVNLLLDDAILPDQETIEILNSGDLVKVDVFQKKPNTKNNKASKNSRSDRSSSSSSSSSSSEDELDNLEQSFKSTKVSESSKKRKCEGDISEQPTKKVSNEILTKEVPTTLPSPGKKKKKSRRKNKNKNKLPQVNVQETLKQPPKPSVKPTVPSQAKVTKFNDSGFDEFSEDTGYTEPKSTISETTIEGEISKKFPEKQDQLERKKGKEKRNKNSSKISDGDHKVVDPTSKESDPQENDTNYNRLIREK